MKLISFYLPQFHEIPENNDAWGKGFTEWVNVKKSRPLFVGHNQPRVPLHGNYYNLMDDSVLEWQAELAKKAGIYGFCLYHYWFNGRMVLEKPIEKLYGNKSIKIHYCISWANESWTKTWHGAGGEREILIPQTYGQEEEWQRHYDYFRKFFLDSRYIKEDNKPMLLLYRVKNIPRFNQMIQYWNQCAKKDGFDGIYIVSMNNSREHIEKSIWINAAVDFEPNRTKSEMRSDAVKIRGAGIRTISYDRLNREMLNRSHQKNQYRTVFVDFDDSPRRGKKAIVMRGSTPQKFQYYLSQVIRKSQQEGNEYIFVNAWNEWGEGNYLEPDEKNRYGYLNAIRKCEDLL